MHEKQRIEELEHQNRELKADLKKVLAAFDTVGLLMGTDTGLSSLPRLLQKVMANPRQFAALAEDVVNVKEKYQL